MELFQFSFQIYNFSNYWFLLITVWAVILEEDSAAASSFSKS